MTFGLVFDTGDSLQEFDEILSFISEIEEQVEVLNGDFNEMTKDIESGLYDGIEELNTFDNELNVLEGTLSNVSVGAKEMTDVLDNGLNNSTEKLNTLDDELSGLKNNVSSVSVGAKKMTETLNKGLNENSKKAKTLGQNFATTFVKAQKDGKSFGQSLKSGVGSAFDSLKAKAKTTTSNISQGFKNVGQVIRHPIKSLKEWATNLIKSRLEAKNTTKETEKLGNEGKKSSNKLVDGFKKFIAIAGTVMIAAKAISASLNFGKKAVEASEVAETVSKSFKNSFGESTSEVDNWAENFSGAIKRNKTEVKQFLTSSNEMFKNFGLDQDVSLELAEVTTSLSYDLSRDLKVDDKEMFDAMQQGLMGSTDALKQYGISLDEVTLKEAAQKMGIKGSLEDLDESMLAQVRLNAIIDQTSDSHGKAEKSLGGFKGGLKAVQSAATELMEKAGDKLAPVFDKFFTMLLDFIPRIEPLLMTFLTLFADNIMMILPPLMDLAEQLLPVLFEVLSEIMPVFMELSSAILPIFVDIIKKILPAILPLIPPLTDLLLQILTPLLPVFVQLVDALLPPMVSLLESILPVLEPLIPVFEFFAKVLSTVVGWIGKLVEGVGGLLSSGIDKISNFFGGTSEKSSSAKAMPKNASGTDDFQGGWTEINEIGGEIISTTGNDVAYLPKGSTIIPADKSQDLIDSLSKGGIDIPKNATFYLAPTETLLHALKELNDLSSKTKVNPKKSSQNDLSFKKPKKDEPDNDPKENQISKSNNSMINMTFNLSEVENVEDFKAFFSSKEFKDIIKNLQEEDKDIQSQKDIIQSSYV